MKKLLFLTNKNNGSFEEEDSELIDFLAKDFELVVSHPQDCLPLLDKVEGVIIRNIWPTHEYADDWLKISQKIKDSGMPTYNSLTGNGDIKGKDYLLDLYKSGYAVIPSVDNLNNLGLLGDKKYYWVKPKDGCDGSGAGKFIKDELEKRNLTDCIIQPYVEFVSEPSFFFIDTIFSHAITMPNRLEDRDVELYEATPEDVLFAQHFAGWNKLPHGIQRIDAVRSKTGELLLTEVEDLCPYLYINEITTNSKQKFLDDIRISILKIINP